LIESNTSRDSEELNVLASRFGATEYDLFCLAFFDCHGYRENDVVLQDMFMEFLQSGAAPSWLRDYVRSRFQSRNLSFDNVKQSALFTTGARNAVVKWRANVDIFTFTLVESHAGEFASDDEQ